MRDPVRAFTPSSFRRMRFSTWGGKIETKQAHLSSSSVLHCAIVECRDEFASPPIAGEWFLSSQASVRIRFSACSQVFDEFYPLGFRFHPLPSTFSARFFHSFFFISIFFLFGIRKRQIVDRFLISSNEILYFRHEAASFEARLWSRRRFNIWNVPSGPEMMLELAVYYRYTHVTFWMSVGERG